MSSLAIYFEGAGPKAQDLECRRAFHKLFDGLGLSRKPQVRPYGSRSEALKAFKVGLARGEAALLLVDSEGPVEQSSPWAHVLTLPHDRWAKPAGASDDHLHFMVQAMEAWLIADPENLARYFGRNFNRKAIPTRPPEEVSIVDLETALKQASKETKRGPYSKGSHSFQILASVDPSKVAATSPWAMRFFETVRRETR